MIQQPMSESEADRTTHDLLYAILATLTRMERVQALHVAAEWENLPPPLRLKAEIEALQGAVHDQRGWRDPYP